jgi:uncharacterized membrane protein SirB2
MIHIVAAGLSGSFFVIRGIWMISDSSLLQKKIVRMAPHAIDTVLLSAAVILVVLTQQYPWAEPWLALKVLALIAYIVLGTFAIRRGKTKRSRVRYLVAAILSFGLMVGVSLAQGSLLS